MKTLLFISLQTTDSDSTIKVTILLDVILHDDNNLQISHWPKNPLNFWRHITCHLCRASFSIPGMIWGSITCYHGNGQPALVTFWQYCRTITSIFFSGCFIYASSLYKTFLNNTTYISRFVTISCLSLFSNLMLIYWKLNPDCFRMLYFTFFRIFTIKMYFHQLKFCTELAIKKQWV